MEKVVPVLQIEDYEGARAFYVDKLGFKIKYEWRNALRFSQLASE